MKTTKSTVTPLSATDSDAALERLNRVTGLRFARWPESLAPRNADTADAAPASNAEVAGDAAIESISA